jgi:hypothetical protein
MTRKEQREAARAKDEQDWITYARYQVDAMNEYARKMGIECVTPQMLSRRSVFKILVSYARRMSKPRKNKPSLSDRLIAQLKKVMTFAHKHGLMKHWYNLTKAIKKEVEENGWQESAQNPEG